MTDFIAALEEQLVTAHRERRPRRFAVPWRGGAVLVAAAVTVAVVVAVVVALASPDKHSATTPPAQEPPQTTPVHPVQPTTVSVLNGTTITGLARAASNKLIANGYGEGVITNDTTNQQRPLSEVFYEPGHRTEAYAVADCLDIRFDRVHPMDANARIAADRADIAIFIGTDMAK